MEITMTLSRELCCHVNRSTHYRQMVLHSFLSLFKLCFENLLNKLLTLKYKLSVYLVQILLCKLEKSKKKIKINICAYSTPLILKFDISKIKT